MCPGILYQPLSSSRRTNFLQANENDKYINDSDDGWGQGSQYSAAGPWVDLEQGSQEKKEIQEGCRKVGGSMWERGRKIETLIANNSNNEIMSAGMNGRLKGKFNMPQNTDIHPLASLPLPTPSPTNIRLACTNQFSYGH